MKKTITIRDITEPFDLSRSVLQKLFAPWTFNNNTLEGGLKFRSKSYRIKIRQGTTGLNMTIHSDYDIGKEVSDFIHDYFRTHLGLQDKLSKFYSKVEQDPPLEEAISNYYGARPFGSPPLQSIVISICSQNTTLQMAENAVENIVKTFGTPTDTERIYTFPDARVLANCDVDELKECKVGYRARYIQDAAKHVLYGKINLDEIREMELSKARDRLMSINGVGPYTADVVLLYGFRRYDSFFVDVNVKKIISSLYFNKADTKEEQLRSFAEEKWGKFKGLALFYILKDHLEK